MKYALQQSIKIIAETVVSMNIVARMKLSSNLKISISAIGYYSYTNRYAPVGETNSFKMEKSFF